MVAGRELAFGLRQVERSAIGFGVCGHQIDEEAEKLQATENIPADEAMRCLHVDYVAQPQRARAHHDADQRKPERKFIGDQLRRGPQGAEQGVLVVGRPAGKRNAVHADRGHAENDEQPDIHVGDVKELDPMPAGSPAERNNRDRS